MAAEAIALLQDFYASGNPNGEHRHSLHLHSFCEPNACNGGTLMCSPSCVQYAQQAWLHEYPDGFQKGYKQASSILLLASCYEVSILNLAVYTHVNAGTFDRAA